MAKQRGIHQISGKVNNLCYYEQKYVRGGLIRRINEAMSGRLKTDPVFANTRRSNSLFGACSMLAKAVLSVFGSMGDLLVYPSRQAKITRYLFNAFRSIGGNIYTSEVSLSDLEQKYLMLCFDRVVKNKLSNYFPSLMRHYRGFGIEENFNIFISSGELETFAKLSKTNYVFIVITGPFEISPCEYNSETEKFNPPFVDILGNVHYVFWEVGDGDFSYTLNTLVPSSHREYLAISIIPSDGQIYGESKLTYSRGTCGLLQVNVSY